MSDASREGFFDRFVHPRLARVALGRVLIWLGSFVIAAAGLGVRGLGRYAFGDLRFFLSGVVGLVGVAVLGACALWLVGVRLQRTVGG